MCTSQQISSGGPQPDATVEYEIDNGRIAHCSANGIVGAARLGHTKLTARATGVDRQTGKQRVYSTDQIDVHVVRLSGVRIATPLTRVRQNTALPVHLTGVDENETPFAFGTCDPPLNIEWTLSDHQSAQLSSVFQPSGLDGVPGASHFAVRLRALQPGHTVLRVRVTGDPQAGQLARAELTDEVSFQVYESLQLVAPLVTGGDAIVMMPSTELKLRTNLDSSTTLDYSVETARDIVQTDGKGNVRSGTSLGQASLLVTATNIFGVSQTLSTLVEVISFIL